MGERPYPPGEGKIGAVIKGPKRGMPLYPLEGILRLKGACLSNENQKGLSYVSSSIPLRLLRAHAGAGPCG